MDNLRKLKLFRNIEEVELKDILSNFTEKKYKKGQTLYHEGSIVHGILVILKGAIEISNYDVNGNKKMVAILNEGEIFAESVALSAEKITPFNISAVKDTTAMLISAEQFYETNNVQLLSNMISILANKNTFLTHKMECLNKTTIKERVYEVLKYYFYTQKSKRIEIPYNKTQLSEYLCVSRSSLAREITKMEDEGYFKNKKNIYELNDQYFK